VAASSRRRVGLLLCDSSVQSLRVLVPGLSSGRMQRNLLLLALCQGLFLTNNITFIAINGLVGFSMAPFGWLATVPIMAYVVGSAVATGLVARVQRQWGRQKAFQSAILVAIGSSLLCFLAAWQRDFWLLVFATFIAGYYQANAQLYRFAAAELATAEYKEKAVSWVLAGGIFGAVLGPNMASYTRDLFDVPFAGSYLGLIGVGVVAAVIMARIDFRPPSDRRAELVTPAEPHARGVASSSPAPRPIGEIMRQPVFIVSALGASIGYGVMNLLMAATPLAMQICGLPFSDAAFVLQWHVIGMFAPGFFTGHLIKRYGPLKVMGAGVFLNLVCIGIALSGTDLEEFTIALFVLGVGWNFLFTASTTMGLSSYRAEEKDKAQGALNFWVFFTMGLSSLGSGALVTTQGWSLLNIASILPIVALGLVLFFYAQAKGPDKPSATS
jgi:MFS family permease